MVASHGNKNSAALAAVAEPKMTNTPKRRVGGKLESRKIPNPQQITRKFVPIGRHRFEHAFDHGSQELKFLLSRLANMVRYIMASTPMPRSRLAAEAVMKSSGMPR